MQKQGSVKERVRLSGHVIREFMSACLRFRCTGTTRTQAVWPWQLFFQVAFKGCLRHQLQAVRRRTGELKNFVASMVSLSARTVNPFLFDLLWQSMLASVDVDWEAYV